jgi:hypothetical protein
MNRTPPSVLTAALALAVLTSANISQAKQRDSKPAIRWEEGKPGCTFSRSDDGKYHYDLWHGDVGVLLAIDSQELDKVRMRNERFFSVFLTVRYRGTESLQVGRPAISLEFVDHFQVVQPSLDPDEFAQKVQNDADNVDYQAARAVKKHPEQRATREAYVRSFQKSAAELIEFISKNSLRSTQLDAGNPETRGWVMFSTENKWLGSWKQQEDFILRVPIEDTVFEFPFKLPPQPGEVLLRKRE